MSTSPLSFEPTLGDCSLSCQQQITKSESVHGTTTRAQSRKAPARAQACAVEMHIEVFEVNECTVNSKRICHTTPSEHLDETPGLNPCRIRAPSVTTLSAEKHPQKNGSSGDYRITITTGSPPPSTHHAWHFFQVAEEQPGTGTPHVGGVADHSHFAPELSPKSWKWFFNKAKCQMI